MSAFAKTAAVIALTACATFAGPPLHPQAAHSSPAVKDFAGTWNWMFQDRRFATMILQMNDDHLTGTVTNGAIDMDRNGRITRAAAMKGSSTIVRTWMDHGALHIISRQGDDQLELAMTLTSPTSAELRFAGEGAPANAEAIHLEKVWSEPPVEP